MDLSILILSFNTSKITRECLSSIYETLKGSLFTFEVIVLDNKSTDTSMDDIKREFPSVKLIESPVNLGFGKGNNELAKHAQSNTLLFLNSDIIVLPNAIQNLYTFYQNHSKEFGFVGGKLFNKDKTPQYSAAPFFTIPVVFAVNFLRGDYWGFTRYSPEKIISADWVSGSCFITTKKIFQELLGFDEKIFMYMEEVDLMYRGRLKGYKTGFYPNAHFIHYGSLSSNGRSEPILNVYGGFLYFYKKHHGRGALFMLKLLLWLKAAIAYSIGVVVRSSYLTKTYEKALTLVQDA